MIVPRRTRRLELDPTLCDLCAFAWEDVAFQSELIDRVSARTDIRQSEDRPYGFRSVNDDVHGE